MDSRSTLPYEEKTPVVLSPWFNGMILYTWYTSTPSVSVFRKTQIKNSRLGLRVVIV